MVKKENNIAHVGSERRAELLTKAGEHCRETVIDLLRASIAKNTREHYALAFSVFCSWCGANGFSALPASSETVLMYLASLKELNYTTSYAKTALSAIRKAHELRGLVLPTADPAVRAAMRGYEKSDEHIPYRSAPATAAVVRALISAVADTADYDKLKKPRDLALLITGFLGAFRRSELCALNVHDLEWTDQKGQEILLIHLRRSKGDPMGKGQIKAFFHTADSRMDPLELIRNWLQVLTAEGVFSAGNDFPLFPAITRGDRIKKTPMCGATVRTVVMRAAQLAGISELHLTPHSLRSGFVTEAVRQGRSERAIMNQTGHRCSYSLRPYIRRETAAENNAAEGLI